MKARPLAIIDTCVLLTFIFGEPEGSVDAESKRERVVAEFAHLRENLFLFGLPAVVPPEITGEKAQPKDGWPPAQDRYSDFVALLEDSSDLLVLELDPDLSMRSSRLAATLPMKSGDATVLASALALEADVLLSWDKKLIKQATKMGQHAREPRIHEGYQAALALQAESSR